MEIFSDKWGLKRHEKLLPLESFNFITTQQLKQRCEFFINKILPVLTQFYLGYLVNQKYLCIKFL